MAEEQPQFNEQNSVSSTPRPRSNPELKRQTWINSIQDNQRFSGYPTKPHYRYNKEEIYCPMFPGHLHVAVSHLRIGMKKSGWHEQACIEVGKGVLHSPINATQFRVLIPFEIRVSRDFYSAIFICEFHSTYLSEEIETYEKRNSVKFSNEEKDKWAQYWVDHVSSRN